MLDTTSRTNLQSDLLASTERLTDELLRDYNELTPAMLRQLRRVNPALVELEEGLWVSAQAGTLVPGATRAERQRIRDELRRLADAGEIELRLHPDSGRVQYIRLNVAR